MARSRPGSWPPRWTGSAGRNESFKPPLPARSGGSACRKSSPAAIFSARTRFPCACGAAGETRRETLLRKASESTAHVAGFGFHSEGTEGSVSLVGCCHRRWQNDPKESTETSGGRGQRPPRRLSGHKRKRHAVREASALWAVARSAKRPAGGPRNERWARPAPSATIERPGVCPKPRQGRGGKRQPCGLLPPKVAKRPVGVNRNERRTRPAAVATIEVADLRVLQTSPNGLFDSLTQAL